MNNSVNYDKKINNKIKVKSMNLSDIKVNKKRKIKSSVIPMNVNNFFIRSGAFCRCQEPFRHTP